MENVNGIRQDEGAGRSVWSCGRVLCVLVSVLLLGYVFSKLDRKALWPALQQARPGWVLGAFAAYGVALWGASRRWHIALRVTERATGPSAAYRVFLIGHFFFVAMLGGIAGDLAKSAVYARWYKCGVPEVIASVPLDRSLGMIATAFLAGVTGGVSITSQQFTGLEALNFFSPRLGLLAVFLVVLALLIILICWRPNAGTFWGRGLLALRAGGKRLLTRPALATEGLLFALLAQAAWSSVLALSLLAVAEGPVPWWRLAWTFPVITVLSSVPFTVAGAGVREIAALKLLGLYGVSPAASIAAALLTLLQKLLWGGIGAAVLWRGETGIQAKAAEA